MNQFNPKKLLHSKWTAVNPVNKEKHFMVISLIWDDAHQKVELCELLAVMTGHVYECKPLAFKDKQAWKMGWK